MGWGSGVLLFDKVCLVLLKAKEEGEISTEIILDIIDAFEDQDCDTFDSSDYVDHPLFKEAFIKTGWHPNAEEDS